MPRKTIAISINASWNIVNFRAGLIRVLQRAGHRVVALAPSDSYSPRLAALGVAHIPLPMDSKGLSPVRDALLLWRYWRALGRLRPDFYLGYTAKPNIYGSLAAHARGIKVINNVSGLGTAFIRDDLLTRFVALLYRLAFRRSATIFFQNEEDRRMFLAGGMARPEQARLLPGSGIDLDHFRPAPPRQGRGFRFLLVARLLWFKGVGEYAEAARLVRQKAPDVRFQLLGFLDPANPNGVGKADLNGGRRKDWSSISAKPTMCGLRRGRRLRGLPSYREGLPRTLLEASAMARPMIATDVPGCRQLVEPGVNGLLCAPRDARSLAEAMLAMLALTEQERNALGKAARARAEAHYDERRVIHAYLEAIAAALKSAGEADARRFGS